MQHLGANHSGNALQSLNYDWDAVGNVKHRNDALTETWELFEYDELDRLIEASVSSALADKTVSVYYDAIGNIEYKSDVGTYTYGENSAGPHAVTSIDRNTAIDPYGLPSFQPEGGYFYDANGNLESGGGRSVSWTVYNKPATMSGEGSNISYLYGPDRARIAKQVDNGKTTYYPFKGHRIEIDNGQTTNRITVGLGGTSFEYLVKPSNVTESRLMLKDHLGSTDKILDANLAVIEELSFDPWGARRNSDWSTATQKISSSTPAGFTGHEMDDSVSLVNMNARIYDPVLGRFLSADSIVPNSKNLQSMNRYSYVENGPMSYKDPSGHKRSSIIAGAQTGARRSVNNNIQSHARSTIGRNLSAGEMHRFKAGGFELGGYTGRSFGGGQLGATNTTRSQVVGVPVYGDRDSGTRGICHLLY